MQDKKDYNLMLRIPVGLKRAIEKRVGRGAISEFLRNAAEERLTTMCSRCKGTGKVVRKL